MKNKYQNSVCQWDAGLLHNYRTLYQTDKGVVEKCMNRMCGEVQFFPWNVKNDVYLSFHIKAALQKSDPLFYKNFPNFKNYER